VTARDRPGPTGPARVVLARDWRHAVPVEEVELASPGLVLARLVSGEWRAWAVGEVAEIRWTAGTAVVA
jgi:hypothetical protein